MTAIDLLKRVYLKFHCGEDKEPDGRILDDIGLFLHGELGQDGVDKWLLSEMPDHDDYVGALGDFWKPEA